MKNFQEQATFGPGILILGPSPSDIPVRYKTMLYTKVSATALREKMGNNLSAVGGD